MMHSMARADETRRVVILAYERVQSLDVTGPAEVFSGASRLLAAEAGAPAYTVEIVTPGGSAVRASSGIQLQPDRSTAGCRGPIDTLVVAGGSGVRRAVEDPALVRWVGTAAGRSRRVASVCSGAFLLAAAGLLDGRRATTHWASCEELSRRHPEVEVDPDAIYVRDGELWTSAGVTTGMDLALAMVEEDLGHEVALEIARWLVVFVQRPGGQSQFSSHLSAQRAEREPLRDLQAWIADNLDQDLRVEALAERAHMSPRNFARAFRREVGLTPGAYVEAVRIERAKQRLERGVEPVETVALDCGFGTAETMRRAFGRRVGVAPSAYRARFRRQPEPTAG
ncbi:MAG TPA: GlxA family transcriptional regulator [Solirubrobacterales bacterium]